MLEVTLILEDSTEKVVMVDCSYFRDDEFDDDLQNVIEAEYGDLDIRDYTYKLAD